MTFEAERERIVRMEAEQKETNAANQIYKFVVFLVPGANSDVARNIGNDWAKRAREFEDLNSGRGNDEELAERAKRAKALGGEFLDEFSKSARKRIANSPEQIAKHLAGIMSGHSTLFVKVETEYPKRA